MTRQQKLNIVRDWEIGYSWKLGHPFCLLCGIVATQAKAERWPGLELAHIIGGAGRSDEPCNLLILCARDHWLFHYTGRWNGQAFERITLAHLLWAKRQRDPGNWNPERLKELRGKALPDVEEPPAFVMEEWKRRR